MMHMTFYWGRRVTLIFDSWKTETWISYGLTLVACFLCSAFYQYMEDRRLRFKIIASTAPNSQQLEAPLLINADGRKMIGGLAGIGSRTANLVGALLFGINSALGYLLMLAVMSFNGGVFLAIVSGLSSGYLVFRSDSSVDDLRLVVDNPCACA
ncbi:Ctr copper transporter [Dillenia turbinata]|uniref:Copper transport protein n=1 Tax=Dillenia turbinata TaxID=194707 RepID=A0AAN8YUE2_9MAGN